VDSLSVDRANWTIVALTATPLIGWLRSTIQTTPRSGDRAGGRA